MAFLASEAGRFVSGQVTSLHGSMVPESLRRLKMGFAGRLRFTYDANGNVGQILNASDQSLVAHYEYDPYGNTIVADDKDSSGYVDRNPMRFSTKWFDDEFVGSGVNGAVG